MFKHFRVKMLLLTLCCIGQQNIAQETQTRKFAAFNRIVSTASIDIWVRQGDSHSILIETENIAADKIQTQLQYGTLTVSMAKGTYWNARAKVIISLPDLQAISLSGTGNIIADGAFKLDKLDLELSSSGNITMNMLIVDQLSVKLFGTGDMQLGGSADEVVIKLSGSGDIQGFGMKILRCEAEIKGSGNIMVFVREAIQAYVSGSGDISYKGNPISESVKSTGQGGIIAIK